MGLRERLEAGRTRRRLLLLLLLLLLVIVGAGFGGFVPDLSPPDEDGPAIDIEGTPTPTPAPTGPTATSTAGTPAATATGTAAPTDTGGPAETQTVAGGTATATPGSPTDTPPPTSVTSPPPETTIPPPTTPAPTTSPPTTPAPTTSPPTSTPPPEQPLDLEFDGNAVIFDYDAVAPGDAGSEAVTLSNSGTIAGNLSIAAISATDSENGLVGVEAEVDDSPSDGELSDHLRLAITVTYPNGTSTALYGTGDGPRPVADLAAIDERSAAGEVPPGEAATVTVDWVVPASTGNVVQSDTVDVTVTFELRAPEE